MTENSNHPKRGLRVHSGILRQKHDQLVRDGVARVSKLGENSGDFRTKNGIIGYPLLDFTVRERALLTVRVKVVVKCELNAPPPVKHKGVWRVAPDDLHVLVKCSEV